MTDQLITLSTYLVAVSLATERLVTFVKSLIPWLDKAPVDAAGLPDLPEERKRKIALQIIAVIAAWITVSLFIDSFNPMTCIPISTDGKMNWPAWMIALLSTGGSTFWNDALGYAKAVKDTKRQERASQRMDLAQKATQRGTNVQDLL
jgi:hypothetical protein